MKKNNKEIEEYLGIEKMFKESNVDVYNKIIDEYKRFEEKYVGYDMILKCDVESHFINIKDMNIIENGEYIVVYIPKVNKDEIVKLKDMLEVLLLKAPSEEVCSDVENDLFADMKNLYESIDNYISFEEN